MKVLNIDGEYFLYPKDVENVDEFAVFLDESMRKFIKIRKLFEKDCVRPYSVLEEIKEVHLSVQNITEFFDEEVVILNRDEYEKMLNNVKAKLCSKCDEHDECLKNNDYKEKLCLDCTCCDFYKED